MYWARICKLLRSPGINSKEPILLSNVAWARICKRLRSPGINSKEPILLANVAYGPLDGASNRRNGSHGADREDPEAPRWGVEARGWWSHPSKSWRSQPSHRQWRDKFQGLVKNKQQEEHRTSSATPAVQRGSVRQRLFFAALQWIAIAQSPKLHQKNQL